MEQIAGFVAPLLAIVLIIITRRALLSLSVAVLVGATLVAFNRGLYVLGGLLRQVFFDPWNLKLIFGLFFLGAFIGIVELAVSNKQIISSLINSKRRVLIKGWITGVLLFIDDYFNILLNGLIMNSFAKKFHVSKEKIALIIHSLGVSACVLIPFSTWTIYITSLLKNSNVSNPFGVFVNSIPFNFYSLSIVLITFAVIVFEINVFNMKRKEDEANLVEVNGSEEKISLVEVLLPSVVLLSVIVFLVFWYTLGSAKLYDVDLTQILVVSSLFGVIFSGLYYYWKLKCSWKALLRSSFGGMRGMSEAVVILILALILGLTFTRLNSAAAISHLSIYFSKNSLYLLTFLLSGGLSFMTSSWATFGILFPLLIPLAAGLGGNLAILTAALISGGVFGDHNSPISSTTIIAKAASKSQVMDHFHTQLPYSIIAFVISMYLFFLIGGV